MNTNDKNIDVVEIKRETRYVGGDWVTVRIGKVAAYLLCFDEPSEEYGINGGRISKLNMRDVNNKWICNYDRGWDKKPTTKEAKVAFDIVITLYN